MYEEYTGKYQNNTFTHCNLLYYTRPNKFSVPKIQREKIKHKGELNIKLLNSRQIGQLREFTTKKQTTTTTNGIILSLRT